MICAICGAPNPPRQWGIAVSEGPDLVVPVCGLQGGSGTVRHYEDEWSEPLRNNLGLQAIMEANGCTERLARAIAEAFAADSLCGDSNWDEVEEALQIANEERCALCRYHNGKEYREKIGHVCADCLKRLESAAVVESTHDLPDPEPKEKEFLILRGDEGRPELVSW